ncbi:exosortase A system-associated hydrolase 2 [Arsukibacterium tuosuense]|uniref:Exosortase A system-associated hydrolase 2 n=2 Tax=Arsukibacterium tuosuense TaxID=1323745 RepID=A0A285IUJ1_9GAMM|nr:exosortase A system-associated hydrolase 2 [Arsukibacterium tuosuense]
MARGFNFLLSSKGEANKALIILPPFADEMNKSRHIICKFIGLATRRGYSCYLMDHFGTGDSEGDLNDADLALWQADLVLLIEQLAAAGYKQVSFLAIRFGALQLFDLLNKNSIALPVEQVLLWQPFFELKKFWQQFFRIKIAEQMALGEKLSQQQLEQQLAEGDVVEIAGYPICQSFYSSTQAGDFQVPGCLTGGAAKLSWLEISQMAAPGANVQKQLNQLQQTSQVNFQLLGEAPFWNTTELADAEDLLRISAGLLEQNHV